MISVAYCSIIGTASHARSAFFLSILRGYTAQKRANPGGSHALGSKSLDLHGDGIGMDCFCNAFASILLFHRELAALRRSRLTAINLSYSKRRRF